MKGGSNAPKLKSMRPLERSYIQALQQRDQDEKLKFKNMYDEFANYNREIVKMKKKNNELQSLISQSSGGGNYIISSQSIIDLKTKLNELLQAKID